MTTFSWTGRLLPAALSRAAAVSELRAAVRDLPSHLRELPGSLRPVALDEVPAGWEQQAYDSTAVDDDALTWLGFEPGQDAPPLLPWPQPERWPATRAVGRHRATDRLPAA